MEPIRAQPLHGPGRWMRLGGAGCAALLVSACAAPPEIYHPTKPYYVARQIDFEDSKPQIERGRPLPLLDGLNHHLLSLPTKLLLWDWRLLDHRLPERNQRILERYLEVNRLRSVKIRHNQYAPLDELRRLLLAHPGDGRRALPHSRAGVVDSTGSGVAEAAS